MPAESARSSAPGTLLDDAGLAPERVLDPLDVGGQCLRDVGAAVGERLDVGNDGRLSMSARVSPSRRGRPPRPASACRGLRLSLPTWPAIVSSMSLRASPSFCRSSSSALVQQRSAIGELVGLRRDGEVDRGAALVDLAQIVLQRAGARMSRPSASFSTWPETISSIAAAAVVQLLQIVFERACQDAATLGQPGDLSGHDLVDLRAAVVHRLGFMSASSARDRMSRPSASLATWPATIWSMPLRLSSILRASRPRAHGRARCGLRRACHDIAGD